MMDTFKTLQRRAGRAITGTNNLPGRIGYATADILEGIVGKTTAHALWLCVLKQAVFDASLPALNGNRCSSCNLQGDKADHRLRCPQLWRSQALNWLRVNSNREGAFAWVCHVLDLDMQEVRGWVYHYLSHKKRLNYDRDYNSTKQGRARNRRYASTEKSRARNRRYNHSAKGRATQWRYQESKEELADSATAQ